MSETNETARYCVAAAHAGGYLIDYLVAEVEEIATRSAAKKALKQRRVLVNGVPEPSGYRVQPEDEIGIRLHPGPPPKPYRMPLEVVWQDEDMAVVYKPPGLPTSGNAFRTLQNVLVGHLEPSILPDALPWPQPVHRLDAPTQGLVLVARTRSARIALGELLAQRDVHKTYHAVVHGALSERVECQVPIEGQAAHSTLVPKVCNPEAHRGTLTLVQLHPHTGRTHQLRIHLAELGHPILGDIQYQNPEDTLQHKGLYLAATRLQLPHPRSQAPLSFSVPVPAKFWKRLGLLPQPLA